MKLFENDVVLSNLAVNGTWMDIVKDLDQMNKLKISMEMSIFGLGYGFKAH